MRVTKFLKLHFIPHKFSDNITFFTERFKKSAGYIAKCEVAPTARIRSRVQSRAEPFLFAMSKIDKKFCLGVF